MSNEKNKTREASFLGTARGRVGSAKVREGGYALIITLFVTAILVAVIVEFAYGVYVSTARAAIFRDSQRASLMAGNGVELAAKALEEITRRRPNMTMDEKGLVFTRTDAGMTLEIRVVDELSKLSPHVVYEKTGVDNANVGGPYARLLDLLGLEAHLMETLSDWIDADDEPRVRGGEAADYYGGLPEPYSPRNGYLDTTDELLMVKGYDRDVYKTIKDYVSPYNTVGLVNVNTAPKTVLRALDDEISGELADEIIRQRAEAPFRDRSDIIKVQGLETIGIGLQNKITVDSRTYRVYSKAASGDVTREVEAVVEVGKGFIYWREG